MSTSDLNDIVAARNMVCIYPVYFRYIETNSNFVVFLFCSNNLFQGSVAEYAAIRRGLNMKDLLFRPNMVHFVSHFFPNLLPPLSRKPPQMPNSCSNQLFVDGYGRKLNKVMWSAVPLDKAKGIEECLWIKTLVSSEGNRNTFQRKNESLLPHVRSK